MPYPYTPGAGDLAARFIPDADDSMTDDEAFEAARDEKLATPYAVCWWLDDVVAHDPLSVRPVNVNAVTDHLPEASIQQLVALIMAGDERQIVQAAYELRERFERDNRADIQERANEILAESTREPEADPYADDPHLWF